MIASRARRPARFALALSAMAIVGCHADMYDQPKFETYAPSTLWKDGSSSRPLVPGTIARGELRADRLKFTGKGRDGKPVDEFPYPMTEAKIKRGQERYNIYCTPCHGATGDGRGMVVLRGMAPPPAFHDQRLRDAPVGHFYDVITNGYGKMYPYAARIPVDDRWAIIAYVRALQLRKNARVEDLSADTRTRLEGAPR